jgi:hypothetical protein
MKVTKRSLEDLCFAIRASGMRDISDDIENSEPERGFFRLSLPEKKHPLAQIWLSIVKPMIEELSLQVRCFFAS